MRNFLDNIYCFWYLNLHQLGRLAQRESTAFTRQGPLVRNQHRPPNKRRTRFTLCPFFYHVFQYVAFLLVSSFHGYEPLYRLPFQGDSTTVAHLWPIPGPPLAHKIACIQ